MLVLCSLFCLCFLISFFMFAVILLFQICQIFLFIFIFIYFFWMLAFHDEWCGRKPIICSFFCDASCDSCRIQKITHRAIPYLLAILERALMRMNWGAFSTRMNISSLLILQCVSSLCFTVKMSTKLDNLLFISWFLVLQTTWI